MRRAFVVSAVTLALGCGAKTGLKIPDAEPGIDASLSDAGPDAPMLDAHCPDRPLVLSRTDVETVFVMDGSGSMGWTWDGRPAGVGLPTRWEIVRDTLAEVLPPVDRQLAIGAKLFPDDGECAVARGLDITPHVGAMDELLTLFDAWRPEGGTPTAMALRRTLEIPSDAPRVIVATMDGGPNCNPDPGVPPEMCVCTGPRRNCLAPPPDGPENCLDAMATLEVVRESYEERGTPVVIVGIDDPSRPDLSDFLDEMALAGGWPRPAGSPRRFFNAREPEDLREAFEEITELVSRCVFVVETPPPEDATVVVRVDGEVVTRDPLHANGWDWSDRERGAVAFFGPSCDAVRGGDATVTADVTCAP